MRTGLCPYGFREKVPQLGKGVAWSSRVPAGRLRVARNREVLGVIVGGRDPRVLQAALHVWGIGRGNELECRPDCWPDAAGLRLLLHEWLEGRARLRPRAPPCSLWSLCCHVRAQENGSGGWWRVYKEYVGSFDGLGEFETDPRRRYLFRFWGGDNGVDWL
jgi:hypothetical protein